MKIAHGELAMLGNQFTAVLGRSGLKQHGEDKPRTLHNCSTQPFIIAPDARTSEVMINRFSGSLIKRHFILPLRWR
jgi:hypothetical protein